MHRHRHTNPHISQHSTVVLAKFHTQIGGCVHFPLYYERFEFNPREASKTYYRFSARARNNEISEARARST